MQGHPVGLMGEDGGTTAGALGDGIQGIESSEHHNPPEMLDGLDGKIAHFFLILRPKFHLDLTYFLIFFCFALQAVLICRSD